MSSILPRYQRSRNLAQFEVLEPRTLLSAALFIPLPVGPPGPATVLAPRPPLLIPLLVNAGPATVIAQVAPDSLAGYTLITAVTSASGDFSAGASALLEFGPVQNTFTLVDVGGGNPHASGTYAYTRTSANTATLTRSVAGAPAVPFDLSFASPGAGAFSVDTPTAAAQGTLIALPPAAGAAPLHALNGLFDEAFYLATNPDVAQAVADHSLPSGLDHFLRFGNAEGRDPSLYFSTPYYLAHNPDVAAALAHHTITSAFDHFRQFGMNEGRDPIGIFNETYYLNANPDVAAAVADHSIASAFQHYLLFGRAEGRLGHA